MNSYREPEYDDTVCACGRKLPETVEPWTWQDQGFCSVGCATSCNEPFYIHGTEPALELARMGHGRGPGFEESLIRDWRKALKDIPDGILWLWKRHGSDDETRAGSGSWAWRVYVSSSRANVAPRCVAFRLTAKE